MMARSSTLLLAGFLLCLAVGCQESESPAIDRTAPLPPLIIKIGALANGEILLDGRPCSLDELAVRLSAAQNRNAQVFYYREAAEEEPHPNAKQAMKLIIQNHIPISFSTLPDFSDYVDQQGESHPR